MRSLTLYGRTWGQLLGVVHEVIRVPETMIERVMNNRDPNVPIHTPVLPPKGEGEEQPVEVPPLIEDREAIYRGIQCCYTKPLTPEMVGDPVGLCISWSGEKGTLPTKGRELVRVTMEVSDGVYFAEFLQMDDGTKYLREALMHMKHSSNMDSLVSFGHLKRCSTALNDIEEIELEAATSPENAEPRPEGSFRREQQGSSQPQGQGQPRSEGGGGNATHGRGQQGGNKDQRGGHGQNHGGGKQHHQHTGK